MPKPQIPFTQRYSNFDSELSITRAKNSAGQDWNTAIEAVLGNCCRDPDALFPKNIKSPRVEGYIERWTQNYIAAYNNRPSQRTSGRIGTVADPIISVIIETRLPQMTSEEIAAISSAHRISMSAENVLGLLLEEYLAERLISQGWYCGWGNTMRSVDFCKKDGELLQIKNRSNSENSSSAAIRDGTPIQKWHRVDATTGVYNWGALRQITGYSELSEDSFTNFVRDTVRSNPNILYVEPELLEIQGKNAKQ